VTERGLDRDRGIITIIILKLIIMKTIMTLRDSMPEKEENKEKSQ
jgi:hypothetical protein